MLKIVEIFKAWVAAENPTPEQEIIAKERLLMCEKCPFIKYNDTLSYHYCSLCGCPLSKKIFSPIIGPESCPERKWIK